MIRFFKFLIKFFLVISLVFSVLLGSGLYYLIVVQPGPEIEESYIESILGRESLVLCRDGKEKIGVLFQDTHRQYLPYHQIPKNFVNAIVAAEDNQFFEHFGIDIKGISRAMIANVKAGRVVQGGSTITQQTAKNIFKRESRTYRAKLKELLFALRLEYHYSKEKILEFYSNQFFVSGNGHGLGVAARYYFDKNVKELTLIEHAFIAGSVKRPNYYNPFTKKSESGSLKAVQRAEKRTGYVLGRMLEEGFIEQEIYEQAKRGKIEFRRGKMSYALNTIIDLVKDGLISPVITESLEQHGISNVSTSGVRIITSIDHELQQKSLYALRRNLSRLDVRLRGYERQSVQQEYAALEYRGDDEVKPRAFLFGTISKLVTDDPAGLRVEVQFKKNKVSGVVDRKGLTRLLTARARWSKQRWSEADEYDLFSLLNQLQEGDSIYTSVRAVDEQGRVLLDLERFPKLQGAALVMQQGMIQAMVGGAENRYFNRAINSKRVMGSVLKPFLFAAALQLGWNSTDLLNNRRNVFVFQGLPYFPRPDHISPYDEVSMSWAGVHSENVAAVWLLCHLLDNLTPPRLRELASHLDMAPRTDGVNTESYAHFRQRIRDSYGIVVNNEALEQAAFDQAVLSLKADFFFDGLVQEYNELKQLPYGTGFKKFSEDISLELADEELALTRSTRERKELELRERILQKNYLSLVSVYESLIKAKKTVEQIILRKQELFSFFQDEGPGISFDGIFKENIQTKKIVYSLLEPDFGRYRLVSKAELLARLEKMSASQQLEFWESVLLEGHISVYIMEQIQIQKKLELDRLAAKAPYTEEVLGTVSDYRIMLGLQYLRQLGNESGISSSLKPVLSFPLGSNVISLLDSVRMYETLITGKRYGFGHLEKEQDDFDDEEPGEGLAIIERIESPEGEVIYSAKTEGGTVFDMKTRLSLSNILQNIVKYGTGRYAKKTVRLSSTISEKQKRLKSLDQPVPLLGKTGTANNFTNASFLGMAPGLGKNNESFLYLEDGSTIGVYVGFDDNSPMAHNTTHITGSVGALPAWSSVAQGFYDSTHSGDRIDDVDMSFNGLTLQYPRAGQVFAAVDPKKGGHVLPSQSVISRHKALSTPSVLTFGRLGAEGVFEAERYFQPFWIHQ